MRPAATLSPGERTRAALALLQARGVNLLVLDEPTNHLDLPAIEQLEQALASYPGTLLLVSHDRRLLDAVTVTRRIIFPPAGSPNSPSPNSSAVTNSQKDQRIRRERGSTQRSRSPRLDEGPGKPPEYGQGRRDVMSQTPGGFIPDDGRITFPAPAHGRGRR